RMCLRIEEDLSVADALFVSLQQVSPGQVVKVTIVKKYTGTLIINVQKRLKVGELVCRSNFGRGPIGKVNVIPRGQLKHQLRLKSALDMEMQFRLWHAFDKILHKPSTHKGYSC